MERAESTESFVDELCGQGTRSDDEEVLLKERAFRTLRRDRTLAGQATRL
jgi:hypothetical protein